MARFLHQVRVRASNLKALEYGSASRLRPHNCVKLSPRDKILYFNILSQASVDFFESLLHHAACAVARAAEACRAWEDGGDPGDVADTARGADEATHGAVEAVAGIDPALALDGYPESRVGRLVLAARLLVLAGTDESGTSTELKLAGRVLKLAISA